MKFTLKKSIAMLIILVTIFSFAVTSYAECYHEWQHMTTLEPPTCTLYGTGMQICSLCQAVESYPISPLGHDELPATCTHPGGCSRCGYNFSPQLEHLFDVYYYMGNYYGECVFCGYVTILPPPY